MPENDQQSTTPTSTPTPNRSVRIATPNDLAFVVALQTKWSNNVGFLTRSALAEYITSGQMLVVLENGQHAGYLNWCCTRKGLVRVPQVALEPDILRTSVGTKIMNHLKRAALRGDCSLIRLTSRSELPANQFWPVLGFNITATYLNPTNRNLPLFEWSLPLINPSDIAAGLLTAGKSFRPLLRKRSPPNLLKQLAAADSKPAR